MPDTEGQQTITDKAGGLELSEVFDYLKARYGLGRADMTAITIDFDAIGMIYVRPTLIIPMPRQARAAIAAAKEAGRG